MKHMQGNILLNRVNNNDIIIFQREAVGNFTAKLTEIEYINYNYSLKWMTIAILLSYMIILY